MSRVGYRLGLLAVGLAGIGVYHVATQGSGLALGGAATKLPMQIAESFTEFTTSRRLLGANSTDECLDDDQPAICLGYGSEACKRLGNDQMWGIILVVLGLLYLFVGIAIICDELFVPALEVIAEDLNLSNDVAGATLMAAGGSAPELATSFVGVFKRSDVGFGTIVGSAVFNVLFVISMCALFTPEKYAPLTLTWWPLARDCSYYVLTLATLAIFMYDGEVELYEAIIQFLMYLGYVLLMKNSEWLEAKVKGQSGSSTPVTQGSPTIAPMDAEAGKAYEMVEKDGTAAGASSADGNASAAAGESANFQRPSTFRAGILQLLTSKSNMLETAAVACVAEIKGDVNEVFDKLDENQNGVIERDELKKLLITLGTKEEDLTDEAVAKAVQEIDKNDTDHISKADFVIWYTRSEERIRAETRKVFNSFDTNTSGTVDKSEVKSLLTQLGNRPSEEEIEQAMSEIQITGQEMTYDEFEKWYTNSLFWEQKKEAAEEAAESAESMWQSVQGGWAELFEPDTPLRAKVMYCITLPLCLFFCLVPDCRPPGCEGLAKYTFIMSIVMIAILAILMVELAEIFGRSLGIPDVVMGLTILAAGTSVPDLLSSVIVAKQGEGDMAVSSSIGSNIFDVAFGLPVPWMVFNIVSMVSGCDCPVIVQSDGLLGSLLVLLGMVAAIVVIIWLCKWEMTHKLGGVMFVLYWLYVAFALGTTPPSDYKVDNCSPFDPIA